LVAIVCGSRATNNHKGVYAALDEIHGEYDLSILITGGANGVDSLAELWAELRGIHCARVRALWDLQGKSAGPKRNHAMLLLSPTLVIVFPGGKGTADMKQIAMYAGIKIVEPEIEL
jgi:hypothetical protein